MRFVSKDQLIVCTLLIVLLGAIYFLFQPKANYYYVINCDIYSVDKILTRSFPGSYCEFFSDGSTLIGLPTELTYYDKHMQILWRKNLSIHHAFHKSIDETKVYILKNSFHSYLGHTCRFDDVEIIDIKTGKIQQTWSSFDNREQLLKLVPWTYDIYGHSNSWGQPEPLAYQADYEFFHFNSIYEIPENSLASELKYLKSGNLIINTGKGPVLFFDQKLNIVHTLLLDSSPNVNTHDVQVLSNGDLLFYRNQSEMLAQSSLQKMDLKSEKIKWSFLGNKNLPSFHSRQLGSVQELEDGFLFSNLSTKGEIVEISRDGELIMSFDNPLINMFKESPSANIISLKKLNLDSYINKSAGY